MSHLLKKKGQRKTDQGDETLGLVSKKPQKNHSLGCGFKETKKETTEKPQPWLWFQRNQKRNHRKTTRLVWFL